MRKLAKAIAQPLTGRKPQLRPMPSTQRARPNLAARFLLLLDRIEMRWSQSGHIDGIWIGYSGSAEFQRVFERVEEALRLIKLHDSLRYARLLRDLDRIYVTLLPDVRGRFKSAFRSCELDERFVLVDTTRPHEIASVIVHEAAHARLMRCGIGYEPELRARVEAVCARRQLAFAAKLPDGEQVNAEADWSPSDLPPDYWADEAMRGRYSQGMANALRFQGAPEFLIRAVLRMAALVARVHYRIDWVKRFFHKERE
jgi:hypothetical protein